tara:strand:+ start:1467 stop:2663 length:1197 start_codon:yes stop_codon:yes gene_type:complete
MTQNNIDFRDFKNQKSELENNINMKIDSNLFKSIYLNAKFNPQINSISKSYLSLKPLYLKTKGKFPRAISKLYSNLNVNNFPKLNFLSQINDKLNKDGFYVQENFISSEEIEKIKLDLENENFTGSGNGYKTSYKELENYEKLKGSDKYFDSIFVSQVNSKPIKKKSSLYQLLKNPFFENIANSYLGSKSFINFLRIIVSKGKNPKYFNDMQTHLSANQFHFDYSHLRSVRFFIYLSDVVDEAGPHTFVKSSHEENFKYPKDQNDFFKVGYRKYYNGTSEGLIKDDWINKNFSAEDQIKFNGKKGTLIIEDTTGFHKGSNCLQGTREVLLFNYAISNIGNPEKKLLPTIEDTKNILDSDPIFSFSEKNKNFSNNYSIETNILRKIKKKIFGKLNNYLI